MDRSSDKHLLSSTIQYEMAGFRATHNPLVVGSIPTRPTTVSPTRSMGGAPSSRDTHSVAEVVASYISDGLTRPVARIDRLLPQG